MSHKRINQLLPADMPAIVEFHKNGNEAVISFKGAWITRNLGQVDRAIYEIEQKNGFSAATLDLSAVDRFDTAGAWLVERLRFSLEKTGKTVTLQGNPEKWDALFKAVKDSASSVRIEPAKRGSYLTAFFETIGKSVYQFLGDFLKIMHILGAMIVGASSPRAGANKIRFVAIFHQIDRLGVGAIPIVVLISTIMGAIIAQQGAFQLRNWGAEIYVASLSGILVLREIGVLLAAIMVAGRSGSAITAELGSMKMREEIDAMRVMGLDPISVLVFPRVVALTISMVLLTVISNIAGLVGAIFVGWAYSGIAPTAFLRLLHEAVTIQDYLAGLIKAPFMAMVIGILAAAEGMSVGGSAESLGRRVTSSVVKSIFLVIVIDGLFAVFYAAINF
ncbi:organic solvent ABC transporter permease [Phyllobacterium salinisoli]|uniref:Organic solvent ABC transporter permease n=1 Tax=Phyllobacterium salinisoli TaxID=1899321 RepID=A0A368JY50_9HYPH|nr:ABC transporter permease [Phyllobacterium salinisoli]RCS21375.1 organic solvent ABC transporter permease [Phyllobacterium salinisoli]